MALMPGSQLLDQDHVALAEIELCGELMIAASVVAEERMSSARIDEILRVERANRAERDERGTRGEGGNRVPVQGPGQETAYGR